MGATVGFQFFRRPHPELVADISILDWRPLADHHQTFRPCMINWVNGWKMFDIHLGALLHPPKQHLLMLMLMLIMLMTMMTQFEADGQEEQ